MPSISFYACIARALLLPCLLLQAGCGKRASDAAGNPSRSKLHRIRFQTDWYPQAEHGGFYQALAKGFYREAGLDVEIISGGPGATVAQRMISGAADVGMSRSDDVALFIADGKPFVMIGVTFQHDPQAILLHEESPVNTFADLDGRTLMAVPGSAWINFLKKRYRIDFSIIPSNFGIARFMADPNFIQQCFITNEPYYVRANGGRPKTLLISDSGFDPYRVYMTTRRFARENEQALKAFVAASNRGWADFINGDPSPAFDLIVSRNAQMSRDFLTYGRSSLQEHHLVAGHRERGEAVGQFSRKRMKNQMRTLVDLKLLKEPLPLETLADFPILGESLSD
ncbi:MAG: ABC transporter substrate-binding protein [Opitutaceae bacterium]|nr:ABC transporter substrate-binding protein [Opitutaceae bacterium]